MFIALELIHITLIYVATLQTMNNSPVYLKPHASASPQDCPPDRRCTVACPPLRERDRRGRTGSGRAFAGGECVRWLSALEERGRGFGFIGGDDRLKTDKQLQHSENCYKDYLYNRCIHFVY